MRIPVLDHIFSADPQREKSQGLIAQELHEIYPYAVTIGGDDTRTNPWGIDYGRITRLIIAAVQDLARRIGLDTRTSQPTTIPQGMIAFFPGRCPSGWTENPNLTGSISISGNSVNVTPCQAP